MYSIWALYLSTRAISRDLSCEGEQEGGSGEGGREGGFLSVRGLIQKDSGPSSGKTFLVERSYSCLFRARKSLLKVV